MVLSKVIHSSKRIRRRLHLMRNGLPEIIRPVLLVGTQRSGTTFFSKCLERHPELFNPGFELADVWSEAGTAIAHPDTSDPDTPPDYCLDNSWQDRLERQRSGFAKRFVLEGGQPGQRLFMKNPHLWNKLPFVEKVFPDATVLIISRDIRSTVASLYVLLDYAQQRWNIQHYLPVDPSFGWSQIPPRSLNGLDPDRLFPGGDVAVLGELWLRAHENIDRHIELFTNRLFLRHRDFVEDPIGSMQKVHRVCAISDIEYEFPEAVDKTRNSRWTKLLDKEQIASLDRFISSNEERIKNLKYADTTL